MVLKAELAKTLHASHAASESFALKKLQGSLIASQQEDEQAS